MFYGYTKIMRQIMADYKAAGLHAVYIDLGYWKREGLSGHHKIVVNDRHPTAYFQRRQHNFDRLDKLDVNVKTFHDGTYILLAGMGEKGAEAEGKQAEQWERDAIQAIRNVTDREIVYRPKPSWLQAKPIPGTRFSPKAEPLDALLKGAHAVVTHHSNVAVEGLVAGVPSFCWKGVAEPMSFIDLKRIEKPFYPEGRDEWAANIAYTQWNIDEMKRGLPWRYMKHEGLIP